MSTQRRTPNLFLPPPRNELRTLLAGLALSCIAACDAAGEGSRSTGDETGQATASGGAADSPAESLQPTDNPNSGTTSPGVSAGGGVSTGADDRPGASGGSGDGTATGGAASSGSDGPAGGASDATSDGSPTSSTSAAEGTADDGGASDGADAGISEQPGASEGSGGSGASDAGGADFDGKELFILFGQSNMSGMSPMPDMPWPINPRVTFMVQYDCPSLGQTKDEWLPAQPPLHGCQWATGGIGLGLADHFGAGLAEAWPEAEIGLIPNAIPAVTIDVFSKGGPSPGGGQKALPDGYTSAYSLMVDRTREAQKLGRVRAILLHQGESDFNQGRAEQWLDTLSQIVSDLRTDLDLGEAVPFIAGEIAPTSTWSGHNEYIRQIPDTIPNAFVVSSEGTDIHDVAHFDAASARVMGQRYVETFLDHADGP